MNLLLMLPARYRVDENPLKAERRVELAVIVLAVVLALWAVAGFAIQQITTGPSALAPAEDAFAVNELELELPLDAAGSSRLLARPLFWQGRRPIEPVVIVEAAKVEEPVKVEKLEGVTVLGVFGAGDSLGLIATIDGKMTRVRKGEAVKGWQLAEFADGVVRFQNRGRVSEVPLSITTPSVKVARARPKAAPARRATDQDTLGFGGAEIVRRRHNSGGPSDD